MTDARPLSLGDIFAATLILSGVVLEFVADQQLRNFHKTIEEPIMQVGLWKYSRHPNYLGQAIVI